MESEEDNEVCIGNKDIEKYIFAVQTQSRKFSEIKIKARGKRMNMAIDVSQISLNKFMSDWCVSAVLIGTEERESNKEVEGYHVGEPNIQKVSFIEIVLQKK